MKSGDKSISLLKINIISAVDTAMNIKLRKTKKDPYKVTIRSTCNLFIKYVKEKRLSKIEANNFLRGDAQQYLFFQKDNRGLVNNTYNGKIGDNRKIWTEIVDLGMANKIHFLSSLNWSYNFGQIQPLDSL